MIRITPRQSTLIFGWFQVHQTLSWSDVIKRKLNLEFLLRVGIRPSKLMVLQPDPEQWIEYAGAKLQHVRVMQLWGANPFTHFKADLGDVLALKLTTVEMFRMNVTYQQLISHGMDERTEKLFRLEEDEWFMLGKPENLSF